MHSKTWNQLAREADVAEEQSFWTDGEKAEYDQAIGKAQELRDGGHFPSTYVAQFNYAQELGEQFTKRHQLRIQRQQMREQVLADFGKVRQWDDENSPPIIETSYADNYGQLYLPPAGPTADMIFDWIAETSDATTGKHTILAGKRYVSFRKGDFRKRLEIALGIIYPEFRRISTHWDVCNVACREAYEIECSCRCNDRHHQEEDYSDFRVVKNSHQVLVKREADDTGIYTTDETVKGSADAMPEPHDEDITTLLTSSSPTDDQRFAYAMFEEQQTELYRDKVVRAIEEAVAGRRKYVGDLRAAK